MTNTRIANRAILFTFFTNLDYLIILPLIPMLVAQGGTSVAATVGLLLSLRVGASFIGTLITPILFGGVRHGSVLWIAAGMKAVAFCVLIMGSSTAIVIFCILTGLGTGFLKPIVRDLISRVVEGDARKRYFQYFFIAMNAAFVAGPLMSELVERSDFLWLVFVALAVIEFAAGYLVYTASRSLGPPESEATGSPWQRIRQGFHYKGCFVGRLPLIYIVGFFFYFAMSLMVTLFVLYDKANPPLGAAKNFFLSLEGLLMIVCQLALLPLIPKMSEQRIFGAAAFLIGIGIAASCTPFWWVTCLALLLFALGECIGLPQIQVTLTELAPPNIRVAAFSMLSLVSTLGEIAGNAVAGFAIQFPLYHLPLLSFVAIGSVVAVAIFLSGAVRFGGR